MSVNAVSKHVWLDVQTTDGLTATDILIKKLRKESLSIRACMERYRISCTAPPKAAPKPSAPAPPSPLLAALFTSELSQPSSSRPKEGMAAVFQEIGFYFDVGFSNLLLPSLRYHLFGWNVVYVAFDWKKAGFKF
ncbi:hypothetical protein Tco_1086255 [Tanacetum coccineum]